MPSSSSQPVYQPPRPGKGGSFSNAKTKNSSSSHPPSSKRGKGKANRSPPLPLFEGPYHDQEYIAREHKNSPVPLKPVHEDTPKSSYGNFSMLVTGKPATYTSVQGRIADGSFQKIIWRTTTTIDMEPLISGIGDHPDKKQSEKLAALSAVYQLQEIGVLENPKKLLPKPQDSTSTTLSDGSTVGYEQARSFMDYYCRTFKFGKPDIAFTPMTKGGQGWEAVMTVGGRCIGLGSGSTKKAAQTTCYLDVTQYLESCDPALWKNYLEAVKTGKDLGMAPKVQFSMSDILNDDIRDLCADIRRSNLYRNRPASGVTQNNATSALSAPHSTLIHNNPAVFIEQKSRQLLERHREYMSNPRFEKMRATRTSLPVYTQAKDLLSHIQANEVTICMAATGSGKTTQIPQIILDDYIQRGDGARCNIICTQPRRLAAISVADRVSKERGEPLGQSVGYQVRFDAKLPQRHGSITFCTTGIFLKRMQSALAEGQQTGTNQLDDVTHIIVDEVHERDVDTDLLLVVLKKVLSERKAKNKPLKIILMSATIDSSLFQKYFGDEYGKPADAIEVSGRSFPVTKYYMDDFVSKLARGPAKWIFQDEIVTKYIIKELGFDGAAAVGVRNLSIRPERLETEELELPYPLIASTIAHVLCSSDDGHVLVFLPGWEEITAVQRVLEQPGGSLGLNFNDASKYAIHRLHSTVPLAEQQVIFDPPPPGVRRIILATNIAETSVTIPDVVFVVDTAKVKEQRYDPERHMSSLVSAWVGTSNLNQRAGRAGRHRSGEYFGMLSKAHVSALDTHQTVEMKRVDLSNVVMHVKALNFPGMAVEEVLAAAIEPPHPERVAAAMKDLQIVGALDVDKNLTSLGRVLLQLPVDAQVGRLVLYGSFFRCLDQALTLAAVLTNRDPFVSPMHLKQEAAAKKNSWTPQEFRSDALATLRAYNAWWSLQSKGEYSRANRFCSENFLAKSTLLMIEKIRTHLLKALYHAGVIDVSAGGRLETTPAFRAPPELNINGESLPLLAALIAIASQPKFAIRTGEKTFRTAKEKIVFIHPSSVNFRRKEQLPDEDSSIVVEKQLYAFAEKRRNVSGTGSAQTYLVTNTRLDPMTYMLFGAYNLEVTERGMECDNWIPIVGNLDALDDIQRLKALMEGCMLRVFEGITMSRRGRSQRLPILPREEEPESEDEEDRDYSLSRDEVKELDFLTRDVVNILNRYSEERISSQSQQNSRPATPMRTPIDSPATQTIRLPAAGSLSLSGYSTPNFYQSRPGTPSRLGRQL
ncbi:P-loop containing nucleoside triphosphate hydrolase protein [Cyathus striatus]|nr:P-loop containing nucleoside triphosphate hydrolase protein [Cyathus striatus]